jgi:phage baseplate assembly protein W
MTAPLEKTVSAFRLVETLHGDTLQRIALREMGDASKWPELVAINDLRWPFITDDPDLASAGIVLSGAPIRVPAASASVDVSVNPDATFLVDASLPRGLLEADGTGDLALCGGLANLRQALVHRVVSQQGDLMFHPAYGSKIKRLIGAINGPTAGVLAAQYASASVRADPRVSKIVGATAEFSGDRIVVGVEAETISGRSISFNEVI